MLRLTAIGKRFGDAVALDGADLVAEPGSVHGVLGETGAGTGPAPRLRHAGCAAPEPSQRPVAAVANGIVAGRTIHVLPGEFLTTRNQKKNGVVSARRANGVHGGNPPDRS